jgi:type II secretory ATPase GspE/PulE/Tfp pilus assembly ATPase PilB-like protein
MNDQPEFVANNGQNDDERSNLGLHPTAHAGLRDELNELLEVVGPGQLGEVIMDRAFSLNATDLHFEPTGNGLRIRIRVDGLLQDLARLPNSAAAQLISRLKVMAGMDIAERRLAQNGHLSYVYRNIARDVRLGSGPTVYGERIILRLQPDPRQFHGLDDLGIDERDTCAMKRCLASPYGLILVVGPVGSGKSTSVYSFLHELNNPHHSIVTIEDPVERRVANICQLQVEPRIGFEFANALRCVLRQDPDIIMVGEIRDAETAQIACRSALTGVLVLSTLHASSSVAAIDVLKNFGVHTPILANCLRGVVSQRLVLQVCPKHRQEYQPSEADCRILNIDPVEAHRYTLVRGIPHDDNFHSGYFGRVGIYEVMEINREIQNGILRNAQANELLEIAVRLGMPTLTDAARKRVIDKVTSIDQFHATALSLED